MCIALDYLNRVNIIKDEVKVEYESLNRKLKLLDLYQQDLLHEVESIESLGINNSINLCIRLRDMRKERREVKNELELLALLINKIGDVDVDFIGTLKETKLKLDELNSNSVYNNRTKFKDGVLVKAKNDNSEEQCELSKNFIHNANTKKGRVVHVLKEVEKDRFECVIKQEGGYSKCFINKKNLIFL